MGEAHSRGEGEGLCAPHDTGNAHHYSHFDKTPAYIAAESSAKEKKLGLWAAEKPINPADWQTLALWN